MEQWTVVLPDRLPAYITAERWRANLARLQANRATADTPGAVREGPALLTGLLRCGRCGAKMTVHYTHRDGVVNGYTYVCCRARADYGLPCCQRLSGRCVDAYLSAALLEMLAPAALEVSLAAAAEIEAERGRLETLWVQRLERAAYAADRAARCYRLAEPENRLVSRTLERDWEQALTELERLREDHDRFLAATPPVLSAADRDRIRGLAADIPALWRAATTTNTDRKQLLRAVIDVVTVTVIGDSEQVTTEIGWAGGDRTSGQLARPVARLEQLSYYPRLVARVLELDDAGLSDTRIADTLNNEGLRPPKTVRNLWPPSNPGPGEPATRHHRPIRPPHPAADPATRTTHLVDARAGRRTGHATGHRLQLDPPRLGHRPPGPRHPALDHHRRPHRTRTPAPTTPPAPRLPRPPPLAQRPRTHPTHRSHSRTTVMNALWLTR